MNYARYLWFPCLMVTLPVFSQSLPFSMGVKGLYSVYDSPTAEQDAWGVEGTVGLEYQGFNAEVGVGYIGLGQSESITPVTIQLKRPFEVAADTHLYLGGGGSWLSGEVRPALSAGLLYQVSPSWRVDVGYQALLNVPDLGSDWFSFGLGVVYRTPSTPMEQEVPVEDVGYLLPMPEPVESVPVAQCQTETKMHQVMPGDYLIKIAKQYEITLSDLLMWNDFKFTGRDINLIYPKESVVYKITICQ
ncbi:LysM peptidoglycan-binding domain-containing protein [Vibrio parahaemolyticus]|uniref:LysM peptidoglycan-binding domain-containing protein n=1 Tax=Vibrio parahaemolyticus TaxID=670 RepID=UPI003892BDBE